MPSIQLSSRLLQVLSRFDPGAFLRWWGTGLLAWLPASWRRWLTQPPTRLLIEIAGNQIVFSREEAGEVEELAQYPLPALLAGDLRDQGRAFIGSAKQIVLCLPGESVLIKTVTLPLAAENSLHQVLGFEIDRLTPFTAGQVYYDVQVLARQRAERRLQVRLIVVLRDFLDALAGRLAEMGLAPARVGIEKAEDEVNLLPVERRPRKSRLVQRLQWGLGALAIVLLCAAAVLPLLQQRQRVQEVVRLETATRPQAEIIFTLRKQLEDTLESSRFILERRRQSPLVIDVLNELTQLLPDSTWIEHLEFNGNEIQLRGQSAEASALIGLLDGSDYFENVTFRSPVTTDRRTGRDRFFLTAQLSRAAS